jgi:hypothetical protein
MRLIQLLLVSFIATSCANLQTTPIMKKDVNYERDISMEVQHAVEGKWTKAVSIRGMGVVPKSSHYLVKVFPPGKADMITLTSCHRVRKTPNPKKKGGWFSKGYYQFQIPMINSVDSDETCFFDIGVFEKKRGRHAWGMLAFTDPFYKMSAISKCNGRATSYGGVSVCQAKSGSIQEYKFKTVVSPSQVKGCEIENINYGIKNSKVWRFLMPSGSCEIEFYDIEDPLNLIHRASLFGFDIIPIRGIR